MVFQKLQKTFAVAVAASLVVTSVPGMDYTKVLAADKQTTKDTDTDDVSVDDGVFKVTMDDTGYITADADNVAANVNTPFSWDNASMYFVITDRFYNGDKSNDHSYGRSTKEKGAENYETRQGTFHGGDLKGLTEKLNEGYFDELGINSIWITAPYEQIHGAMSGDGFKSYPYHGYWTLDFSNMDANMGTEADMEEFVDTAHKHGIRVVMDVVMNHVGYPDPYTANEYGFGSLADNWEEIYYNWEETKYKWYNDYVGDAQSNGSQGMMNYSGSWATKWYGPSWVRAVSSRFEGYDGTESGGDLTICSTGLPDIKTEDGKDNGIPPILKTKWTKEKRYDQEVKELDDFFSESGLPRRNVNYVVKWLTDYVKEYGIDGFRCDTAKHIELEHWNTLQKQCDKALKEWRKNNPTKPGADWQDDFWMTGEVYGYSGGKNDYFSNGFASLINFGFQGVGGQKGSALESTYSSYASSINSDPGYNLLSYISSHDKGLGARGANSGTALLLCPGGVQIYYGDETARTGAGYANNEQGWRSQMNWGQNKDCLSNYQKIGQFRREHIAVGAGKHTKIADSPYTFSRTYEGKATVGAEKKTDYKDAVVVCLPGQATTTDVTVGDTFGDATTVRDAYSGETYEISGGKVSGVTCDSNGVILLEVPSEGVVTSKSSVSVSPSGKTYNDDIVKVTLNAKEATDTFYQINDGEKIAYKHGDTVEIGGDTAYEEETVIKLTGKGTDSEGKAIDLAKEAKFTRGKEPAVGAQSGDFLVRVKKSDFKEAPQIYVYDDTHKWAETGDTAYTGAWPGKTMTVEGDYYVYRNEEIKTPVKAIVFTADESWRSTPDKKDPDSISGSVELVKGASSGTFEKVEISTGEKCKVTIKYVDKATGKAIKEIYRVGEEGAEYNTYPLVAPKSGYKLEATPENATGKFTKDEITVTYNYIASDVTPDPATPTPTATVPATTGPVITATPTAEPTATPEVTATPTVVPDSTPEATVTPTVAPTNPPIEEPATEAPTPTAVVTTTPSAIPSATPTVEPSATPVAFAAKISTSPASKQVAGKVVTIKASAQGTTGKCTYKYVVENSAGTQVFKKGYSSSKSCSWKPDKAGTYVVTVYVKDAETGMVCTAEKSFKVSSAALVLKKLSAVNLGKLKVKLTATTTGGVGTVKYKFTYKYKGKTKVLKNYSKTSSFKKVFKKPGTYKFTVYVKDSTNKVKKKTVTIKVKK